MSGNISIPCFACVTIRGISFSQMNFDARNAELKNRTATSRLGQRLFDLGLPFGTRLDAFVRPQFNHPATLQHCDMLREPIQPRFVFTAVAHENLCSGHNFARSLGSKSSAPRRPHCFQAGFPGDAQRFSPRLRRAGTVQLILIKVSRRTPSSDDRNLFSCPQGLLRAVGADDDSPISVSDTHGTAGTVTLLNSPAHAAVNQKQQPVALEESVLFSVSFVRELHLAWLMALDQMSDTQPLSIFRKQLLRIDVGIAIVEPGQTVRTFLVETRLQNRVVTD